MALALLGQTGAALEVLTTLIQGYDPSRKSAHGERIIAITQSLAAGVATTSR
jgi:hypothetical protein